MFTVIGLKNQISEIVEMISYSQENYSVMTKFQKKEFLSKCGSGVLEIAGDNKNLHLKYKREVFVNEIAIIKKVQDFGTYPIKLKKGNVTILYEPRDLSYFVDTSEINNEEYLELKKGNRFRFSGHVISSIFKKEENVLSFTFYVKNNQNSKVNKAHKKAAHGYGIYKGLIGLFIGGLFGGIVCDHFLPMYKVNQYFIEHYHIVLYFELPMLVTGLVGGIIAYVIYYAKLRRWFPKIEP